MSRSSEESTPLDRRISRRTILGAAAGLSVAASVGPPLAAQASPIVGADQIYPRGNQFPLAWYDIGAHRPPGELPEPLPPLDAMRIERGYGWNIVHRYNNVVGEFEERTLETIALAESARMASLIQIPRDLDPNLPGGYKPKPEDYVAAYVAERAASGSLAWWDFPEEMRYWYPNEMAVISEYAKWTRRYDPMRRPNFLYTPNHYRAVNLVNYVPHLDIVPVSAYTKYAKQPHIWVRWRLEQLMEAIRLLGAAIGSDYLAGQKTPVAALELYHAPNGWQMTPEGAYHDFWSAIAAGAQGILVYSFYRRIGGDFLLPCLDRYNQAAAEFTGPQGPHQAVLFGANAPEVAVEVTAGPAMADPFTPIGVTTPVVLPSVNHLAKRHEGFLNVIVVNSNDKPVSVRIGGLRRENGIALLPSEKRQVPITKGTVTLDFAPLGVHVLRIDER